MYRVSHIYDVADYRYRMVKHSNVIFSDIMNKTCISLCVKFQLHKSTVTKIMNLRRMMGQMGLRLSNNKCDVM